MNAIRGAGAAGLSSIPRRRNRIVRPLLDRTHEELCDLLRMRGIVWREDATNEDTRYLRAYVRHEVMPVVRARNPRVTASLAATCDILSDEDAYLTSVAARAQRELTRRSGEGLVVLDAARLAALDVAIARRVVRASVLSVCPAARLEARHVASVLRAVAAGEGSLTIPMGVSARVRHGLLVLRARSEAPAPVAAWLEVPGRLTLPDGRALVARLLPVPAGADPAELARFHALEWEGGSVLLDARAAGVDPARGGGSGWMFRTPATCSAPLGCTASRRRCPTCSGRPTFRSRSGRFAPVVRTSATGSIVWVAPVRADERVRCVATTDHFLELSLVSAS